MSSNRLTLADITMQQDPDGAPAQIVEVLNRANPLLQDAPALPSNAEVGNRVTVRANLPAVAWGKINKGVDKSKSLTTQRVDSMGMIEALSELDVKEKKIVGGTAFSAARRNQDVAFLEAMSIEAAGTAFYGNELTEPAAFTGLAPRLASSATAITGSQVKIHHSSPTGGDNTSIYIVDWHRDYAHFIYPMKDEHGAGIDAQDKGEQRVTDDAGKPFFAMTMHYLWSIGLTIKDARHIARLANIDMSQAQTDSSTLLNDSLVDILTAMPSRNGANRVGYCARTLLAAFWKQVNNKSNLSITIQEYLGEQTPHFWGMPLRACDEISVTESAIS